MVRLGLSWSVVSCQRCWRRKLDQESGRCSRGMSLIRRKVTKCDVADIRDMGRRLTKPPLFRPGEPSGERDGNDSSVLAESGVTKDCLREPARTVPDLREAVDICDADLSSLILLLDSAMIVYASRAGRYHVASVVVILQHVRCHSEKCGRQILRLFATCKITAGTYQQVQRKGWDAVAQVIYAKQITRRCTTLL